MNLQSNTQFQWESILKGKAKEVFLQGKRQWVAFWGHLLCGPCLPNFSYRSLPPMYIGLLLWVAQWKSRDPGF